MAMVVCIVTGVLLLASPRAVRVFQSFLQQKTILVLLCFVAKILLMCILGDGRVARSLRGAHLLGLAVWDWRRVMPSEALETPYMRMSNWIKFVKTSVIGDRSLAAPTSLTAATYPSFHWCIP